MKMYIQSDSWIYSTFIVLGTILILSAAGVIFLIVMWHSISEILVALCIVAGAGLAKLFISPLNRSLFE